MASSMSCSARISRWCGGSRVPNPQTTSAARSWIPSASPPGTALVRCFPAPVSGTASVGLMVPGGLGYLRPPAEIELGAYGLDLRGLRVADIGAGEGRLALGAARDAASVLAVDPRIAHRTPVRGDRSAEAQLGFAVAGN